MVPDFEITERQGPGDAVVLALSGELDLATVSTLEERLEEAATDGQSVVLDLTDLDFIDSSGLRVLLRASGDASREGWNFAITPPPPRVQRVFEVAGVEELLPLAQV